MEKHVKTPKRCQRIQDASTSQHMTQFVVQIATPESLKVWAIEGTLAYHTIKHHQSFRSMDCTSLLIRSIFVDSSLAKKISCARTKNESIVNGVLSMHSMMMIIR